MEPQKFTIIAEGKGRLDILNRISALYIQRHIPVESLSFSPIENGNSRYRVCALANEETIRKVVGQMNNIIDLHEVRYSVL